MNIIQTKIELGQSHNKKITKNKMTMKYEHETAPTAKG